MSAPKTLVVLQLTGGNDPLNTIVPYTNPLYFDNRPDVYIPAENVLPINIEYGFHPSMAALKPLWDEQNMAIIGGIGHSFTNYSHFRSLDIWYTAEPEEVASDGWLGKAVRELDPHAENVLTAVNVGRGLPRALSLAGVPVSSVAQLDSYGLLTHLSGVDERNSAMDVFSCMYDDGFNDNKIDRPFRVGRADDPQSKALEYMGRTGLDARKGAEILGATRNSYSSNVQYPRTLIGANLRAIAQMQLAKIGTRIFYTSHSGFDTHADQLVTQASLLKEMSEALSAFFDDLRSHNAAKDVVVFVFSEFGRRVADNGAGTDHGAAGVAFVIGEAVKGGMYGEYPSLADEAMELGNLRYSTDFRSTYSSLLEGILEVEAVPILRRAYDRLLFA